MDTKIDHNKLKVKKKRKENNKLKIEFYYSSLAQIKKSFITKIYYSFTILITVDDVHERHKVPI